MNNINKNKIMENLYRSREDSLYALNSEDKIKLGKLFSEKKIKDEQLTIAISNIPNVFTETTKNLKKAIEEKVEILMEISSYDNEKFYKAGFSDAINLIMECKNNENNYEYKDFKTR